LPLEEKLTAKFKLNVKYYTVFNAKQIENIPAYVKVQNPIKLNDIEEKFLPKLIKNMEVEVVHNNGGKAYYAPLQDKVCLPFKENFEDGYSYSATLLHELGHATGNKKRLDRDLTGRFGSESYAKEELRAEIAASFVAGELNLDPNKAVDDENHKAYIQG
jgi:antirestriction protein ArdC